MIHINIGSNLDSKFGTRFDNITIAVQLLVNGFLNEIIGDIKSNSVRKFIENKIEIQIHGY